MNNSEQRVTDIVEEEIIDTVDENDEQRDEVFKNLKIALVEQKRLLARFSTFCDEYNSFEYDEMGMNMEEGEDILRKTNKIRDKFLAVIEEKLLYIFQNVETHTLTHIITFALDTKDNQYKVILEVLEESFNLEVK
ncbi:MAG: hypothetical protein U9R39_05760 [Campylobacterota bacterium]|nr:hypothetical protein [Campylobacterota bacterium]